MESRLNADMQNQSALSLPPSPAGPAAPQQYGLLPPAQPQSAQQPIVDASYGLPSERVYQQAEEQQRQQQTRPAALLPRNPAEFSARPEQQPERTVTGTLGDIGVTALKGAVSLPQAFVGLADIPTGGRVGKALENIGYRPGETQEILSDWYSPAQKYAEEQVQQAKGFIPTLKAAVQNPSTIARAVGESAPLMLGGAGVARGILSKAPAMLARIAPAFGMSAEVLAGAIGEGTIGAGAMAESIREQTENGLLTPKQSAAAIGSGIGTALFSAAGGRLAQKLGIEDIDTLLAGGRFKKPDQVAKAIVAGGISEGLFEEMPQEMQETVWQNAATGRPLLEGAAEAGAQALLAGAAMGSGANIVTGSASQESVGEDQGGTVTVDQISAQAAPVTDIGSATEMIESLDLALGTGQINPSDPAQAETVNSIRQQMQAVINSPDKQVQDVVAQNRDVLERIGALGPEQTGETGKQQVGLEIGQATQFQGREPSKTAPETGFREPQADLQPTGEPQFTEEVALARAQAIQPKDRTPEEAKLVKDYQERADAEELVIRRARAIDDQYRTPEEREIVRAAEQREQEGYAKEELETGQAAQETEETGARAGERKLPPIESLAGVIDFKNTSLDELQGIVRKVQKTPFEQLSDQEKRVAEAIGGGQVQPGTVQQGEQAATRSPEAKAVTGQVQGDTAKFSEQSGTLGIPRAEMPQITSEQRGALANNLRSKGIEYTRTEKTPIDLKPSQAEFSPEKVQQAREYTGPERAILVSKDGHVIDGHHQWMQKLDDAPNDPIPVIELGGNAQDVIRAVREFPGATTAGGYKGPVKQQSSKVKEEKQPVDASEGKKKAEGSRKELLEPITEKEGAAQLGTEKRTRYLGEQETKDAPAESKRRQIGESKKFQEERRDPEKHTQITEQRDYKDKLPKSAERLMNITADRYRTFNDAQASVDENKEHLVKLFNKAGVDSITVTVDGKKFTVKKPLPGKEQVIMNLAGRDALDALKQKYKDAGLLSFDYDQGVTLMVQPAIAGKSKAAAYGPKTLESAAREHVKFMRELAEARFARDAARKRIKETVLPNLRDNGIDHVWTNSAKNTTFWVERSPAIKKFSTEEAKEAYQQERKETQARPEFEKKRTRELKTAGISEGKAQGLKRGEKADRQAAAEAELDQILKSISGTPLPKGQRADIMAELTGQYGRGVIAQQKRGVFEVVSQERAAKAIRGDRNNIELKRSAGNQRLEGLTFPDGRVWLVDGNIETGTASGVFAHELGVHARKLGFNDEKSFQAILKRVEALAKTDEQVKAARARVPENTPAQNVNEETIAYLVSDAPQHGIVKRLISAVKRFLAQRGWFSMTFDELTPSDLQALAQSAVRADMPAVTRATAGVNEFAQSVKMSTAKAADKIKGMANFKKWFGDSKIVDENGDPKVVYHGTATAGITSFSHKIATDKLGRKMGLGLGKGKFYLTEYEMSAKMAAEGAVARGAGDTPQAMPFYVKVENPMTMEEYNRRFQEMSGGRGVSSSPYEGSYTMKKRDALIKKLDTSIRKEGFDGIIDDVTGQIAVFEPTQIKSIHNTGEWSAGDPDIMKSYAGERAKTANVKTLAEAKVMQKAGEDNEAIRQATGWFQGPDKEWRFEIDDSNIMIKDVSPKKVYQVSDALVAEDLFSAYPELAEMPLNIDRGGVKGGSVGEFQGLDRGIAMTNYVLGKSKKDENRIAEIEQEEEYKKVFDISNEEAAKMSDKEIDDLLVGFKYSPLGIEYNNLRRSEGSIDTEYMKNVLLHEIQHAIQDIEGFAQGGDEKTANEERIKRIKGNKENLELYLKDIGYDSWKEITMPKVIKKEMSFNEFQENRQRFIDNSDYADEINSIQEEIDKLTKFTSYENYMRLAGEIESRDVESRRKMTAEQRKETKPYESQGIPEEDMIVRFGNGIMASMSAPAQEARRNTENLNATKDGQTSTTSAEAGEKAIQSIMETLRKVTQKTEAELDKSKAKEKRLLDQYRKLSDGMEAMPINESVDLLNGIVRQADIPDGSKKRIGQLINSITAAKRPETQRKRLGIALDKLRSDISSRFRSQIIAQVKRAAGPQRESVIKRGRYWHEQEKDITAIREIVHNMSPEQATQAIARVESRLDGLHERLKGVAQENAEAIRSQITDAELRLHHLRTFGGLKDKSLDQLLDAKYQIEELRRLGRSKLRAVKEAWQQEIDRKTNWLAQEITGQDDPRPETVAQKNRRKQKEKSLVGKAKGAYQAVENSIQSWEHLLDRMTIKSGKKILQSRAVKELGSMAHAATRGAERYNRETTEQMLAKGLEIFGVKKGGALTKRLQKLAKKTGNIKVAGDTLQISPMEAAYFYNVRKEPGSEKLFKKMGFTPETWSGIDSLMTKELKEWADYLHDDLLAGALQGETEAYRAVNGVDRAPVGLFRDDQTDIPVMNLNSAVMNRIFDANHYRAWAVPSKTFNDLFSVPETRGYIEQYAGTSTLKALDKFLEDFAKTPRELRGDMAWMDKLRSNVVMSMIGANPTTFFKQLTSIPAYAADIPTAAFVKNFAHGMANFGAVRRMIKDSQMAQERFGSGYDRDIHEASKQTAEQVIGGKITNMRDILMAMTKLGDMAAVYAGYTVYKYHYDKNKSKGHAEAHRIGIEEFERATERTQQAAGVKDRGSFERGSSLQKLLTMYMTSPAAYTRQTMAALRHFKTDPVGSSKRLLLFNVMLPMAFQAVASGFVGASGDDDEQWEEFWANELRAVALGPFLGLPIARDIAAGLWDSAMGEWYGSDVQHSPVTETTKSLTQAVFHASKGIMEFDDEAIEKAKGELLDFLGYAAGLPIKPGRRMQEGIEDFLSGDTEHPLLSLSGYSRAARDERYLGE